jgi:prepilin-type N-terminal cleavage/methylation domain-containing protein
MPGRDGPLGRPCVCIGPLGREQHERNARFTSRAGFTVIELLIVIGVLSILLSILLPVFSSVREASLRARARMEVTALAQAVIQYKNIYGYWPGMVTESGGALKIETFSNPAGYLDWPLVSNYSNTWFTVSVRTSGGSSGSPANYVKENTLYRSLLPFDARNSAANNRNPLNPQRIRFLDLKGESDITHVSLPDPWGHEYIVVMGLNPTTTFTHEFQREGAGTLYRLTTSNMVAFALSLGGDSTKTNSYIFSAGVQ